VALGVLEAPVVRLAETEDYLQPQQTVLAAKVLQEVPQFQLPPMQNMVALAVQEKRLLLLAALMAAVRFMAEAVVALVADTRQHQPSQLLALVVHLQLIQQAVVVQLEQVVLHPLLVALVQQLTRRAVVLAAVVVAQPFRLLQQEQLEALEELAVEAVEAEVSA
jgi:hypothetical protein